MPLLSFTNQGFSLFNNIIDNRTLETIINTIQPSHSLSGGYRDVLNQSWCQTLAHNLKSQPLLSTIIPKDYVATQCTYFEKSTQTNWLVPYHQDLSILVKHRIDHPDLASWSQKVEGLFVSPPTEVLASLIVVRLHLDNCFEQDGALKVLPTTHLMGKLSNTEVFQLKQTANEVLCTIGQGGVVVMRPLLLHASSKATGTSLRRVLHFTYAPATLPLGLEWAISVA